MCNKKKLRGRSISGEFWLSLNPKWHLPHYGMWYMLDSQRHANQFDIINLWYIMDKWKVQILQKIYHSIPLLRVAVIFNKDTKWDSIAKRFVKCSIINFVIIPVMIVKKKNACKLFTCTGIQPWDEDWQEWQDGSQLHLSWL